MKFMIGDRVQWSSQAQGTHLKKWGTVVQIIPEQSVPDLSGFPFREFGCPSFGLGRKGESYLVRADVKIGSKARPKLYWPVASLLRQAEVK